MLTKIMYCVGELFTQLDQALLEDTEVDIEASRKEYASMVSTALIENFPGVEIKVSHHEKEPSKVEIEYSEYTPDTEAQEWWDKDTIRVLTGKVYQSFNWLVDRAGKQVFYGDLA